jgi:hypothetical protein
MAFNGTIQIDHMQDQSTHLYPALGLGDWIVQGDNLGARHPLDKLNASAAAQIDRRDHIKAHG